MGRVVVAIVRVRHGGLRPAHLVGRRRLLAIQVVGAIGLHRKHPRRDPPLQGRAEVLHNVAHTVPGRRDRGRCTLAAVVPRRRRWHPADLVRGHARLASEVVGAIGVHLQHLRRHPLLLRGAEVLDLVAHLEALAALLLRRFGGLERADLVRRYIGFAIQAVSAVRVHGLDLGGDPTAERHAEVLYHVARAVGGNAVTLLLGRAGALGTPLRRRLLRGLRGAELVPGHAGLAVQVVGAAGVHGYDLRRDPAISCDAQVLHHVSWAVDGCRARLWPPNLVESYVRLAIEVEGAARVDLQDPCRDPRALGGAEVLHSLACLVGGAHLARGHVRLAIKIEAAIVFYLDHLRHNPLALRRAVVFDDVAGREGGVGTTGGRLLRRPAELARGHVGLAVEVVGAAGVDLENLRRDPLAHAGAQVLDGVADGEAGCRHLDLRQVKERGLGSEALHQHRRGADGRRGISRALRGVVPGGEAPGGHGAQGR
mmetsp:Transcript_2933/g.8437  ORF Transcript_2933/g.8437 Transcript_2933/m.8437 type:complete len:482 (+) Transcript_2933:162-1607(+)